jgi:SAM-dependent methyltransferase
MPEKKVRAIGRYYDWLSRYQTLVRRLGHKGGFDPLTVHRLLSSDRPGVAAADVVHDRLVAALGSVRRPRVIDAGCGLGGTIFFLHSRLGGQYDGLTLSSVQCARAEREAEKRGISRDCRFRVRSYDGMLDDVAPDGADLIVAIESLAHAEDPERTIANLARSLGAGGRLAIVDDVPGDALPEADEDFVAFRTGWSCPAVARESRLAAAFAASSLTVEHHEDLTPLVPLRDAHALERLVRSNRTWRRVFGATAAGLLVDSLYGGLMLERLYRRGLMRYRFLLLRMAA